MHRGPSYTSNRTMCLLRLGAEALLYGNYMGIDTYCAHTYCSYWTRDFSLCHTLERRHVRACIARPIVENKKTDGQVNFNQTKIFSCENGVTYIAHLTLKSILASSFYSFRFSFGAAQTLLGGRDYIRVFSKASRLSIFRFEYSFFWWCYISPVIRLRCVHAKLHTHTHTRSHARTHAHTCSNYSTHSPNSKQIDSRWIEMLL